MRKDPLDDFVKKFTQLMVVVFIVLCILFGFIGYLLVQTFEMLEIYLQG